MNTTMFDEIYGQNRKKKHAYLLKCDDVIKTLN